MQFRKSFITTFVVVASQILPTHCASTTIGGDKMGAAIYVDGHSDTFIVYQAQDTTLSGLRGSGAAGDTKPTIQASSGALT